MQEQKPLVLIQEFQKKLDALRNKIAIQQSLMTSITAEFESLYTGFDSLRHNFDSTSGKFDPTRDKIDSTSYLFDSTSDKADSSSTQFDPTSENFDSTRDKVDSSSLLSDSTSGNSDATSSGVIEKVIRSASAIKVYFGQPDIPVRITKILSAVSKKKALSASEMQVLTGASRSSIVRDMKILRRMGWLKFNGSRKNGYFTLTEEGAKAVEG